MAKAKGYITSVNVDYNNAEMFEFGDPHPVFIPRPPETRIEMIITDGDIGALLEHMEGVTSPIEIELPNGNTVAKKEEKPKIRKWRLIEVGNED